MGQPAARITDMHVCPMVTGVVPHVGGPISGPCAANVLTGKLPQARVTDMCVCVGPPDVIVKGSATVLVNKLPTARMGDLTAHGGAIVIGLPTVLIGDAGGAGGGSMSGMLSQGAGLSSPQAQAQINASKSGKPFCARCEAAKRAREAREAKEAEDA